MRCSAEIPEPGGWPDAFAGLDQADRQAMAQWLRHAAGFDGIEDFSARPWSDTWSGTILGVFQAGQDRAAWLLILNTGWWIAARCDHDSVSEPVLSLREALGLIA